MDERIPDDVEGRMVDSAPPPLPSFIGAGVEAEPIVPAETIKDFIRETLPKEFEARLARGL